MFLVAAAIASVDLFGLSDHTRQFSRDLFFRVASVFYPGSADKAVGVVLLDDRSIAEWDVYPVRYGTHAQFLQAILARGPKAVFVDFAFVDQRDDPSLAELVDVIKAFNAKNIPLYLPVYAIEGKGRIRPEFEQLAAEGRIRLVSFELGRFVLGNSTYVLKSKIEGVETVAARIVRDFHPEILTGIRGVDEIELWWGLPSDPLNCGPPRAPCTVDTSGVAARIASALQAEFFGRKVFSDIPEGVQAPYTPFAFADETLSGDGADLVGKVLTNKFVFYGPFLSLVADRHANPVFSFASDQRDIPGVFVHAMAVENLIDLKSAVKTPRSEDNVAVWRHDVVVIAFITVCLLAFRLCVSETRWWAELGVIFLASLCVAWFEFAVLAIGPSNWVGVFALVTISNAWIEQRVDKSLQDVWAWLTQKWNRGGARAHQ